MTVPSATSFVVLNFSVTAAGTAEQLASHFVPEGMEVIVTARPGNSGKMYIGSSKSNAESGPREEFEFGRSAAYRIANTDLLFVDADNTSDDLEIRIQKTPSSGG